MSGMNRVTLFGNLGADPELRTAPGGLSILHLRLATNETYVDKNQERQERTEWHDVVVFGARAEGLAKALKKGERLLVEGRLSTSSYEKEGVKRWRTEIVARDVFFAGGRAPAPYALEGESRSADAAPPLAKGGANGSRMRPELTEELPF